MSSCERVTDSDVEGGESPTCAVFYAARSFTRSVTHSLMSKFDARRVSRIVRNSTALPHRIGKAITALKSSVWLRRNINRGTGDAARPQLQPLGPQGAPFHCPPLGLSESLENRGGHVQQSGPRTIEGPIHEQHTRTESRVHDVVPAPLTSVVLKQLAWNTTERRRPSKART